MVNEITCTQCGGAGLEPGFMTDVGQGARGFAQWVAGPLEVGAFGNARFRGRRRLAVSAFRCPACSHLEFFARS